MLYRPGVRCQRIIFIQIILGVSDWLKAPGKCVDQIWKTIAVSSKMTSIVQDNARKRRGFQKDLGTRLR